MSEGTWEKLSQVAVKGAEYDSRERQPHPKCLKGTRVVLLDHIYELLDNKAKSQLIWLHGTAGVGKSAVAFTVAERMKGLKMTEETKVEKRLAGTFFFSRKHTKRRMTGYFFATLAYQLATNFPSVRKDVNRAILENPALLDADKCLRDQMEGLFLQPLRKLQSRLRECPPLTFVVDALDECTPEPANEPSSEPLDASTSENELVDLISLLGEALCDSDMPVTHILLTSRSEEHIRKAMQTEDMRTLVCEIPVKTSGEGVAATISLDGADVDNDIYIFLQHSFRELGSRHPDFPQPSADQLARLASRAGRRFIVASTMMKFIDDQNHDPRNRLHLMLELTSELLPGTEVFKLYDRILSTCSDPTLAYLHLSVVAALADPLPISQISKLLGPGQGRDVETVLVQLRSIIDVPIDITLPVNVYHSSVRDYVSHRSNCSLRQVQYITSPHSLLALSSLQLMTHEISESAALLDAFSQLSKHSQAMEPRNPRDLKHSLAFMVQPPESMQVLITLLWLRGNPSELQFWLDTLDGRVWLQTLAGREWLQTDDGQEWLQTQAGREWLQTHAGKDWLQTLGARDWMQTQGGQDWLKIRAGRDWLQTRGGKDWLQTQSGKDWLQTLSARDWKQTQGGKDLLKIQAGQDWLQTQGGKDWLQTRGGKKWLQTRGGKDWLQTQGGKDWLQTQGGDDWLQTQGGKDWLQTWHGRNWLQTQGWEDWPQTWGQRDRFGSHLFRLNRDLEEPLEEDEQASNICISNWMETWMGPRPSLLLASSSGRLVQTMNGGHRLQTLGGREWLQYHGGSWLQSLGGREWLQSMNGREWLQTLGGRGWLQTSAREWLQTSGGRDWLQTPHGQAWRLMSVWGAMEEFSNTWEVIREYRIAPESPLRPAFHVIQQFKTLPDFLMFPVFLALRHQDHSPSVLPQSRAAPDMEIIHAINAFSSFAYKVHAQNQAASDALNYACQNWVIHLSRAPNPWDEKLVHIFKSFWNHHLLSWLERQWCLKDLQSCLTILTDGQKLAKEHLLEALSSQ